MDAEELRKLWEEAGGAGDAPPSGDGLMGLPVTRDPSALTGVTLAALGLPLNGEPGWPDAVRRASAAYAGWLPALAGGFRAADYGNVEVVSDDLAVAFVQAHERLADIVAAGATPLVLGGDALVSVPVLQVLSGKLRGRLGVVAFTPACEVAPKPLYAAASRWTRALELGVLAPANMVVVGVRSDPAQGPARTVLDRAGATVVALDDVVRDGVLTVAQEALELATSGTEALYISVDVGLIAGVGDPVGLQARELVAGVRVLTGALVAAADICVPSAAAGEGSAAVAARVAAEIVSGVARRLS